ncbi:MAG: hypothetical protein JO168_21905 [Solirubrobacterales bacterium]|nr:hypothetical protein [Solirubrobacterales bacterium]
MGRLKKLHVLVGALAVSAVLSVVPGGASAAERRVDVQGSVSVAVGETPTGHIVKYFLRQGTRLYGLDLNAAQRRSLEPNEQVSIAGVKRGSSIDVDHVQSVGPAAAVAVTGTQSVLVMRVYWNQRDTVSKQDAVNQVAVTDDEFYRENSYNRLGLTASATPWLQIAQPTSCDDIGAINNSAQAAATAAGIDTSVFNHDMIYISSADCIGRGWAEIGGRITWIQGTLNTYRTAHELGHNLGLVHAHSKSCTDAAGSPVALSESCVSSEYGDSFDIMGYVPPGFDENSPLQLSAPQKDALGWLSGRSLAVSDGTYTLAPTEDQAASLHALKLDIPGHTLWLEYRQPSGMDAPLASFPGITAGVLVHEAEPTTGSWLLDMTPGSLGGFNDAALPVGNTWTDIARTVTVRTDSLGPGGATVTIGIGVCQQIKNQIQDNLDQISILQGDLGEAPPSLKPAILSKIRALEAQNAKLSQQATQLRC